jgi:hypothetical protein
MDAKGHLDARWSSRGPAHYALVVGSVRFCRFRPSALFVPTQPPAGRSRIRNLSQPARHSPKEMNREKRLIDHLVGHRLLLQH